MNTLHLIIYGKGGHARVIQDAVAHPRLHIAAFIDDTSAFEAGDHVGTVPTYRSWDEAFEATGGTASTIIAIGDNAARHKIACRLLDDGQSLYTVKHPRAVISPSALIGPGTFVGPNAVINSGARVGFASIINSCACVEHDCTIGDGVHIGPSATLAGWSSIGDRTFIGSGAVVRDRISVGADAVVGMGSVVISSIASGTTAVGCPARPLPRSTINTRPA